MALDLRSILQSYLFAFLFWLGISLGSLVVSMVSYIVGGHWGVPIRRIAIAGAKTIWLMALFFVPILLNLNSIYPWTGVQASDPLVQHKSPYLNVTFFIIRAAIYFIAWILLAWRVNAEYSREAHSVAGEVIAAHKSLASLGIIVYFLLATFAGIDWIMSLQTDWISTALAFVLITAQALAGMAFAILVIAFIGRRSRLSELASVNFGPSSYFRDLGSLLLVSIMLWAYVFYFEFLIVWAGNIPNELTWYINRSNGGWTWVFIGVFALQFVLPFIFLITSWAKRNGRILTVLAALILLGELGFYFWLIIPAFRPQQLSLQVWDILLPAGMGVIWLVVYAFHLRRTPELIIEQADLVSHNLEAEEHQPA